MPNLLIFEDEGYKNFGPLTSMRATYELKCGILPLFEKIISTYQNAAKDRAPKSKLPKAAQKISVTLGCRSLLAQVLRNRYPDKKINSVSKTNTCLFINGRILANQALPEIMPSSGPDEIFICDGTIVGARLSGSNLAAVLKLLKTKTPEAALAAVKNKVKNTKIKVVLIDYPWQLVNQNPAQIEADFKSIWQTGQRKKAVTCDLCIYHKEKVVLEDGVIVDSFVVIDAKHGPVIIDKEVHILPHTLIEGPCYIGPHSVVLGGQIRAGTTIGPHCKIQGEVSMSIIHGYTNKAHYGFLGHAYLCEWVNLGAGTTNSNLKNNYGQVKVEINGKLVDSGEQFVGCFIGDHTKTAIGTLINTGTVISIFCNIFGGMPPKYVAPFSFGPKEKYDLKKAIETAGLAMSRRDKKLSPAEQKLIEQLF